jgi:RimJ/RimL family protein N-acetyltransferase
MELKFLKFRPMEPSDAKEYKDAINETLDDLKLFKSTLVENPNISVRKTELAIRANQYFQKLNEDFFVLMNGKRMVAYGYAVKRPNREWSELGLWVRKSYQGQGIGVHMLRLLALHAFKHHSPIGVYVVVDSSNSRMCRTAFKLGFAQDSILKREAISEIDAENLRSGKVSGVDLHLILMREDMGSLNIEKFPIDA